MKELFSNWTMVALFVTVPVISACGTDTTDRPDYASQVNDSLSAANLDDVRADWIDDQQELRLSGEVQSADQRARAEEVAQQVVGTTGRIVNEVMVEGVDTADMDSQIEERLSQMFEDRTEWDFDGTGVSFDAEASVVTITGTVESQEIKDRIGERASQLTEVREVVNNLEVDPDAGVGTTTP